MLTKQGGMWNLKLGNKCGWTFEIKDGLAPCFTIKYVGSYEIIVKPHLNVYMLKLPISFVAHSIFHVFCKLF
jgi:hypothetical protein